VVTADLDRELAASVAELIAAGRLPAAASEVTTAGTWRPAPDGDPATYATAVSFEIGRLAAIPAVTLAAALAERLRAVRWVKAAGPSGDGYLTITVTPQAQAASAASMLKAGLTCSQSTIMRGVPATVRPWPNPAAAISWQHAWREQADAMIGRLARAAGASATMFSERELPQRERGSTGELTGRPLPPPVQAAVAYFGVDSVRYRLARTLPGEAARLSRIARPGVRTADPLYSVQQAHAAAASTLRWAVELQLDTCDPGERAGELLSAPAEHAMLGLLSFLPVRVAAAARRGRPDELPRYLEHLSTAWLACQQAAPALPFGGQSAARDPYVVSARLLLAGAVAAALAAGLALTGIAAADRL
jgi:arginyl-tRNA synthetase